MRIIDLSYWLILFFLRFCFVQNRELFWNSKHKKPGNYQYDCNNERHHLHSFFFFFWLTSLRLLIYLSCCQGLLQRVHSLNFKARVCSEWLPAKWKLCSSEIQSWIQAQRKIASLVKRFLKLWADFRLIVFKFTCLLNWRCLFVTKARLFCIYYWSWAPLPGWLSITGYLYERQSWKQHVYMTWKKEKVTCRTLAINKHKASIFQALATNVWFKNFFHSLLGKYDAKYFIIHILVFFLLWSNSLWSNT